MQPMGPAPVMSTSSPTTSNLRAQWVALPKGSRKAAMSSEMSGGSLKALLAGRSRYSAKQPGRLTPTPTVLRQRWRLPARQLRQWPQVMWPSPETRSPAAKPLTSLPTSTISPTNSWPTCIGTGMVRCGPLVPVVDVDVGAADGRLADLDEDVVGADLGDRHLLHPDAGLAPGLDEGLQAITPISRPTLPKAAMARSMCAGAWPADICTRMRACPFGTTG